MQIYLNKFYTNLNILIIFKLYIFSAEREKLDKFATINPTIDLNKQEEFPHGQ